MKRVAIIGAGFGGLALAIRLQSAGIETTLFEGRDKPGGRAYVWHKSGYTFDAGPTVITDPACLRELWALSGADMDRDVTLAPVSPFYRLLWPDGTCFDYSNDDAMLAEQIAALDAADVAGYQRFLRYAEGVYHEGYEKLGAVPFLDFGAMIRAAPALARYQAWRSVLGMVSGFVRNEKLRQALSFHTLLVGGNPMTTSSIYALIHKLERDGGVWFAMGGTNALVAAMVRQFERLGGRIRLGDPVVRIETEADRASAVRTRKGFHETYYAVASNGDNVHSYGLLNGHPRGRKASAKLRRKRFSPSLFVVHFGTRGIWPDLAHHSILFGPRYEGLLKDIYRRGRLADDPSLYLHNPCRTDPSLAPDGCSSLYALAPVPHLGAGIDWESEGPRYRDLILGMLEERLMPGLRDRIEVCFHYTPEDFASDLGAHLGSAFSLEPLLTQSAWFRAHNRDDVIDNLYFVGAGTHPGAGIPGVVGSAKATAGLMIDDLA